MSQMFCFTICPVCVCFAARKSLKKNIPSNQVYSDFPASDIWA